MNRTRFAALVIAALLPLPVPVHSVKVPAPGVHQTLHVIRQTLADVQDLELQSLQVQLGAVVADRNQLAAQTQDQQAKINDLQSQVDSLKGQLMARSVGFGGSGGGGGIFAFGYCTWYVATRRSIPWSGNAIEWWANAAAMGFAEGYSPRPGAIMVTRDSWWGHVAYVERVNGDGSWVVSEMNWSGWDYVDWRTVRPGGTLVGFIY